MGTTKTTPTQKGGGVKAGGGIKRPITTTIIANIMTRTKVAVIDEFNILSHGLGRKDMTEQQLMDMISRLVKAEL